MSKKKTAGVIDFATLEEEERKDLARKHGIVYVSGKFTVRLVPKGKGQPPLYQVFTEGTMATSGDVGFKADVDGLSMAICVCDRKAGVKVDAKRAVADAQRLHK